MTHIVCRALVCVFWEQGSCSAEEIEYEPDVGCLTFQDMSELDHAEDKELLAWAEDDEDALDGDGGREWEEPDWDEEELDV